MATDPLDVLRWVGTLKLPDLMRTVEDALCAAELHAVRSSAPTPYAREVIVAARKVGKPIAIVSNNSAGAVIETDGGSMDGRASGNGRAL